MSERIIHLVRHGETDWNKEFRVQGSFDTPLSDTGIKQALELAGKIRQIKFDRVYTSYLKRAIKTAEIALEGLDVPVHKHQGFNERKFGEYEGRLIQEIEAEFGKGALNLRTTLGGETNNEFTLRVNSTFNEVLTLHPQDTILIIAHGGTIRELNQRLSNSAKMDDEIGYEIGNCSIITHTLL